MVLAWLVIFSQIRTELEMQMVCNLREFKEFIDNEMIVILGQMDSPTEIFDHVFLVRTQEPEFLPLLLYLPATYS